MTVKNLVSINLLALIIVMAFLNKLLFAVMIPLWHMPDEQAHFAQIAYYGEFNKMPSGAEDLTREIYASEVLLGTNRDERGNNSFTYHPEHNIEYTNSLIGKYEDQIKDFPKSYRFELVRQEAARYPPLYYFLTAAPYKIFYDADLISRVFLIRLVSIFLGLGMFILSIYIAKIIFPKNYLMQITLLILVAFQPMLNFVSAGVTSDNLLNFLFTAVILLSLLFIKNGLKKTYFLWSILVFLLLYLTKPQFILSVPIFFLSITMGLFLNNKINKKTLSLTLLSGLGIFSLFLFGIKSTSFFEFIQKFYNQDFYPGSSVSLASFTEFTKMTLTKTLHETIPWYWGVYKWLSLVLPIEILRIINRVLALAGIGLIVKAYLIFSRKRTREDYMMIFLVVSSLIYALGIFCYDLLTYSRLNFSFGLQGRYFFPMFVAHMILILVGLTTLVEAKRLAFLKSTYIKAIGLGMVALYLASFWVVAKSYYDLSSFGTFVTQVSQYKPAVFKGHSITGLLTIYLIFMVSFLIKYFRLNYKKTEPV